jgi:hypothetical protein
MQWVEIQIQHGDKCTDRIFLLVDMDTVQDMVMVTVVGKQCNKDTILKILILYFKREQ